jgi:hypothetical protein
MNRNQNLFAGIGKVNQLAQSGLGFTKGGNHETTMVLILVYSRGMLLGLTVNSAAPDKVAPHLERPLPPQERVTPGLGKINDLP